MIAIWRNPRNRAEHSLYVAQIQLAYNALSRPHAGTVEDTLERWTPEPGRPDHRGWEWYYLLSQSRKNVTWALHDHILPVRNVAWSDDSARFASVGDDGVVRIWSVETGKEAGQLAKVQSSPCRIRWSPDGRTIATGHVDGTVHLWDAASYEAQSTLEGHKASLKGFPGVSSIDFSRDAESLATCGWDQTIRIWDLVEHKLLQTIVFQRTSQGPPPPSWGTDDWETCPLQVTLSPDGERVAAISSRVCVIWDVATGQEVLDLSDSKSLGRCVAFNPDGTRIAVGGIGDPDGYKAVAVFDVNSGRELVKLRGHREAPHTVKWNSSGDRIVTGSYDHTIRIWSAADGGAAGHARRSQGNCA